MPTEIGDKRVFTLLELGQSVQRMFDQHYNKRYWVKVEMNKLNLYGRTGHCHPDLVEKRDGQVVAEMRANLWKADYQRIDAQFRKVLGEPLREGIKMLCQCTINFHPKYGLSLRIIDIDVDFTLGDLARERSETLQRLGAQNLLVRNKEVHLPMLSKRIAIISVETSNGYADFVKVLRNNPYGYLFEHELFPSLLQGDRAVGTMLRELKKIAARQSEFDFVAIIRGGGGDVGLSFLNKYELAHAVATFPLPVVTGIGHATNQTVVELIAHQDAITPTEMAEWLVQRHRELELGLMQAERQLINVPREIIYGAHEALDQNSKLLRSEVRRAISESGHALDSIQVGLQQYTRWHIFQSRKNLQAAQGSVSQLAQELLSTERADIHDASQILEQIPETYLSEQQLAIEAIARNVRNMSPEQVLKRGYSITRQAGKAVLSVADLEKGATFETEFYDGSATSTVTDTQPDE